MTPSTVGDSTDPPHTLVLDYSTKSAQILDHAGRCVAHYAPGVDSRDTALARVAADGWQPLPDGDWTYTSPPDGRRLPLTRRPPCPPGPTPPTQRR